MLEAGQLGESGGFLGFVELVTFIFSTWIAQAKIRVSILKCVFVGDLLRIVLW